MMNTQSLMMMMMLCVMCLCLSSCMGSMMSGGPFGSLFSGIGGLFGGLGDLFGGGGGGLQSAGNVRDQTTGFMGGVNRDWCKKCQASNWTSFSDEHVTNKQCTTDGGYWTQEYCTSHGFI